MRTPLPVARLLSDLIAIPSVNPAFGADQPQWTGEAAVAEHLIDHAHRVGLEVERQEVATNRFNVLIRYRPEQADGERVLLAPHMDTVRVIDPVQLQPTIRDGRLYGRGACDTKGSIAAMFDALRRLTESETRPAKTEILLACLVDEENAQAGSRHFAKTSGKISLGIVGEPTQLQPVCAHKGALWMRLSTKGKAAHASKPHLGASAIQAMARVILDFEGDYRESLNQVQHPLLGSPSINVGVIHGGAQPNIVPDQCEALIDRRTLPGESDEGIMETLARRCQDLGIDVGVANDKGLPSPAMEAPLDHPPLQNFIRAVGGLEPVGVDYFCDAAILDAAGIPCVVYGPGDIAQAHTSDEWIALSQLESASDQLLNYFQSLP